MSEKKKVWVVDDDYDELQFLFEGFFKSSPFDFVYFGSTESALQKFTFYDRDDIGLILLDIMFGDDGEAGLKALPHFKRMEPDIPVLMMTRYPDPESEYGFISGRYKASAFLKKDTYLPAPGEPIESKLGKFRKVINEFIDWIPSYDREQQKIANEVADVYMIGETESPATLALWLLEDEIIVDYLRKLLNSHSSDEIRVLDLGCGTGRFELLLWEHFKDKIKDGRLIIQGIDFAGKMLKVAVDSIENRCFLSPTSPTTPIKFFRGIAENLPFDEDEYFDLIIMGFGIISYTDYTRALQEVYRVLKPGGYLIGSAYNADALYHQVKGAFPSDELPFAMDITKQEAGRDKLLIRLKGNQTQIDVDLFSIEEILKTLKYFGFKTIEKPFSFPTLFSLLPKSKLHREESEPALAHPIYKNDEFSLKLFKLDVNMSRELIDKGVYITLKCVKPE
jgi:SAM-dependent methyltransferase